MFLDSGKSQLYLQFMSDYEIVYSDDPNFKKRCKVCGKFPCACPKASDLKPNEHQLKVRREVNGRGRKKSSGEKDDGSNWASMSQTYTN